MINGDGLCEAGNHAKQAPGWSQKVEPDGSITTRTPTGHTYRSELPDPPRGSPDRRRPPARRPGHHFVIDLRWAA